jgi:ribosomal protein S12 methylthiotransferase accessory factor
MEALEGFHAEDIRTPCIQDTIGSMRSQLGYDLHGLALNHPALLNDGLRVEWLPATDLVTGGPSWVPRQLCNLDLRADLRFDVPIFRTSSNGLCSGNTTAEALLHGLCEVIERDSCLRYDEARFEPDRCVAPDTISSGLAQRLLRQFSSAGMRIQITDMSGPTGLPCFEVWLDHPDGPSLTRGSGCHPAKAVALIRALTEAAQSRLTYIAGSRDDIPRRIYRAPSECRPRRVFQPSTTAERNFSAAPTMPFAPFGAQIRNIAQRIRAVTGMSPMGVDLMRDDLQLPVFFVIAPGLGTRISI